MTIGGNMRWLTNQKTMSSLPSTGPGTGSRSTRTASSSASGKAASSACGAAEPEALVQRSR